MRWLDRITDLMDMSLNKLQEIFLTQGLNPGLMHCRETLYLRMLVLVLDYMERQLLASFQLSTDISA